MSLPENQLSFLKTKETNARGGAQSLMLAGPRRCFLKDQMGQELVKVSYFFIVAANGVLALREWCVSCHIKKSQGSQQQVLGS